MLWLLFSRYSSGDTNVPFSLQSCSKPLTYCMVQSNDDNIERVHKYVGHEPSGRSFNEISLDYQSMERYIIQSIWFNLNSNCPYACPHFHTIVNSIQKVNWQKFWISSILFCWCWECHYNGLAMTQINMLYHSIPCFIVKIWCMKLDLFQRNHTTQW